MIVRIAPFVFVVVTIITTPLMAQAPLVPQVNDALDRLAREEQRRKEAEDRNKKDTAPQKVEAETLPPTLQGKPTCFAIKSVEVNGYEQLGNAQRALPLDVHSLEGKCVSVVDIARHLTHFNRFYQNKGYTTTRAYVPEQNLKTGVLKFTVVVGKIANIKYKKQEADRALKLAFPTEKDAILNLRHLEQGLDNLNSLPSHDAKFELIPGQKPGESIVEVNLNDKKRWRTSLGFDNAGQVSTGVYNSKLDVGFDNLFGLNDMLTIGGGTNLDREYRNRKSSNGSIGFAVPIGNWMFNIGGGAQSYLFDIPGINDIYRSFGYSGRVSSGLEYMFYRDQTAKYYATADITRKTARNFNSGYEIISQRRDLSVASLGVRGKNYFGKSLLEWKLGGKFGLDILGAEHLKNSDTSHLFQILTFNASWRQPLNETWLWKSAVSGQYNRNSLPGSEQFSIGGRYDVRGFQEDTLYGNAGVYWRNELEWQYLKKPLAGQDFILTSLLGVDGGIIQIPKGIEWSSPNLAGVTLGQRLQWGQNVTFDIHYARAIHRPKEFTHNLEKVYFGMTFAY